MKRVMVMVVVALIAISGLLLPRLRALDSTDASYASDPVTISSYDATYSIDAHGRLEATETIVATFPYGRHGIFRYWDLSDTADRGIRYRPQDVSISMDGRSEPVSYLWERGKRFRVAKIGSPDRYVSEGVHTYTISYRIDGAILPATPSDGDAASASWADAGNERSMFAWSVVAPGWQMDIRRAHIRIHLPVASKRAQCLVGRDAAQSCRITGVGTKMIALDTGQLQPRTPVLLRADLPMQTPAAERLPWSVDWDTVFGTSVPLLALLLILGFGGLGVGIWWERRTREADPGFPVVYEPPAGLGPVQTAYVAEERVPAKALVATLLHQAERGLTTLSDDGNGQWTVTGRGDTEQWDQVDAVTRSVGSALDVTTAGNRFAADGSVAAGKTLQAVDLRGAVKTWAKEESVVLPESFEVRGRVLVVVAIILAVAGSFNFFLPSIVALPFMGFAIGGCPMLLSGVGTRRTRKGRDLWSRSGGFERLLSTNSSRERLDFSARKDLYTAYIPYAVAFECAELWANKYRIHTGQEPPTPSWFAAPAGVHSGFDGGSAITGFESSLRSSISAYTATQGSSSSGGSGGGSSGGGGGGGSW